MKKATIEKEVFIDENPTGDTVSGYLTLKATETITLDGIRGKVFIELRGRMYTHKHEVLDLDILDKKELIKNKSYEIPFSIDLYSLQDLYQGVNASISYFLDIKLIIKKKDAKKLEKSLFSKYNFTEIKNIITLHKYFSIKKINEDFNYQVIEEESNFTTYLPLSLCITGCLFPPFSMVLIAYTLVEFFGLEKSSLIMFFSVVSGLSLIALRFQIRKYIIYSIGQIYITTFHDEDGFICKISTKEKINLDTPTLHYEITEKVVDNRGTTNHTHTESLFTSTTYQLDISKENQEFKFLYPSKRGLQPYDIGNVSVGWNMVIRGKYIGIPIDCQCPIKVELIARF